MAIVNPKDLLATLAGSKALKANDAAYQVLTRLIGLIGSNQSNITNLIQNNTDGIVEINVVIDRIKSTTFITESDARALFANSFQLVAGSNITFDLSTPGELIISSTGGNSDNLVPMTTGSIPGQILFIGSKVMLTNV